MSNVDVRSAQQRTYLGGVSSAPLLSTDSFMRSPMASGSAVDGEFLVLRADTGAVVTLNATGAFLWEATGDRTTVAALADALRKRFGIDEARSMADGTAFAQAMLDRGLLLPTEAG